MARPPNWLWMNALDNEDEQKVLQGERREWDRWAAAGRYRRTPTKRAMREAGLDALLDGWRPEAPFIDGTTRVVAYGSCFAARFAEWLIERGVNAVLGDGSEDALVRNPIENPLSVAQQFRWAFGEPVPEGLVWIDRSKVWIQPTPGRREHLRRTLEAADVLVITFGIAEYWLDIPSGEPMWRVPLQKMFDPQRHVHRVGTVAEVLRALETIEGIRARFLSKTKIVFTLSPQRLSGTYQPVSPVTANSASKAILRAALDEFLRDHPERNRALFYFPGYEMVNDVMIDPLQDDNLHLGEWQARKVVAAFARAFSSIPVEDGPDGVVCDELHASIQALEAKVDSLQRVCDERLDVIRELDQAVTQLREATTVKDLERVCEERLETIRALDEEVRRLRATPPSAERAAGSTEPRSIVSRLISLLRGRAGESPV